MARRARNGRLSGEAGIRIRGRTYPLRAIYNVPFSALWPTNMNDRSRTAAAINWRRGFHRVFALLCVLWVLFLFVGYPIKMANDASGFAARMHSSSLDNPEIDPTARAERERQNKELWEHALLPYIYKHQVLPELHLFVGAAIVVPALLYGLIRAAVALVRWLYRGFKSP